MRCNDALEACNQGSINSGRSVNVVITRKSVIQGFGLSISAIAVMFNGFRATRFRSQMTCSACEQGSLVSVEETELARLSTSRRPSEQQLKLIVLSVVMRSIS